MSDRSGEPAGSSGPAPRSASRGSSTPRDRGTSTPKAPARGPRRCLPTRIAGLLLAAAALASGSEAQELGFVDLPAADLRFAPLADYAAVPPEPPALYTAARVSRLVERARFALYVVPAPVDATDADAWDGAILAAVFVADTLPEEFRREGDQLVGIEDDDARAVALRVATFGDRRVAALLWGESASVRADANRLEALLRSVGAASGTIPFEAAPESPAIARVFEDARLGVRLRVPLPEADARGEDRDVLFAARSGIHTGIPAFARVRLARLDLQDDLDAAIRASAARITEREPDSTFDAEPDASEDPFPARVLRGRDAALGQDIRLWIIGLARHRVLLEARFPSLHAALFARSFDAALARAETVERRIAAEPLRRYEDVEEGFSIGIPPGMERDPRPSSGEVARFTDAGSRPPQSRLVVRRADADDSTPPLLELARAGRHGDTAQPPPREHTVNGLDAVTVRAQSVEDGVPCVELRTLLRSERSVFEIGFFGPESDAGAFDACALPVLLSFRVQDPTLAPELAGWVEDEGIRVRPPAAFERAAGGTGVRFEDGAGGVFEAGFAPIPDANPLGGIAERYRGAFEAALKASGARLVRIEDCGTDAGVARDHHAYLAAYTLEGKPMRELRFALFVERGVAWAGARAPAERFGGMRMAFERAVRTVAPR